MNTFIHDIAPKGRDICFFDLETTGLSSYAEIIEIGAIRVESDAFNVMEEFEIKVKPLHIERADPEALEMNSYDEEIWQKEAVEPKVALEKFLDFAGGSILSAHNLPMDWMWLQRSLEDNGLDPNYVYAGIDTISLAWLVFKRENPQERLSLGNLSRVFDIERKNAHSALDDAKTAYSVFLRLIDTQDKNNA